MPNDRFEQGGPDRHARRTRLLEERAHLAPELAARYEELERANAELGYLAQEALALPDQIRTAQNELLDARYRRFFRALPGGELAMLIATVLGSTVNASSGRLEPLAVRSAAEDVQMRKELLRARRIAQRNAPSAMADAEARQVEAEYLVRLVIAELPLAVQERLVEISEALAELR